MKSPRYRIQRWILNQRLCDIPFQQFRSVLNFKMAAGNINRLQEMLWKSHHVKVRKDWLKACTQFLIDENQVWLYNAYFFLHYWFMHSIIQRIMRCEELDTAGPTNILSLYVSCTKALTIIHFQASISWHAWITSFPFAVLVHSLMLSKYIILCLHFALLPSIFPNSDKGKISVLEYTVVLVHSFSFSMKSLAFFLRTTLILLTPNLSLKKLRKPNL